MILDFFTKKNKQNKKSVEDSDKDYILNTFIELTSKTYPYLTEDTLVIDMMYKGVFPHDIEQDKYGNYFYKIGESRTIFASHLDVSCNKQEDVKHIITKDGIVATDGKTVLGADDKAGVTIMLYMMKNQIPGLYYFFIGEEVGCIGSGDAAKHGDFSGKYDRIISFDRRGTSSIITHQSSSRCCSDDFANQLATSFNKTNLGFSFKKDNTGVYTDSAEFTEVIPECTNISVGYYSEHTKKETQDIKHLQKLAVACTMIDWEVLVTKRDPKSKDSFEYSYSGYNWRDRDKGWQHQNGWNRSYYDSKYTDESYDFDFEKERGKKKRKRNNKKGKTYFESGSKLVPIHNGNKISVSTFETKKDFFKTDQYEWIMDKFYYGTLTPEELETIKNQYMDMENPMERESYEFLKLQITENSL
jgi:hypothetical protein